MTKHLCLWAIATSFAAIAGAAPQETPLLERAGERVKLFWEEISVVTSVEQISQEKLNEDGKVVLRSSSRYDSLTLLHWDGDQLLADESRVEIDPPRKNKPNGSLLATRGFSTLMLILHPTFRSSYSFSLPEEDAALVRVRFVPRTGGRSPGAMELKGREYPIEWEGTAWIDPATAAVVRVEARWKNPPEAMGLRTLESDVRYAPVSIRGRTYWLPQTARVELRTAHQSWRNIHEFTRYKSFDVDVEDRFKGTLP